MVRPNFSRSLGTGKASEAWDPSRPKWRVELKADQVQEGSRTERKITVEKPRAESSRGKRPEGVKSQRNEEQSLRVRQMMLERKLNGEK